MVFFLDEQSMAEITPKILALQDWFYTPHLFFVEIDEFIARGGDVNRIDEHGNDLLLYVIDHIDAVIYLLKHGAQVREIHMRYVQGHLAHYKETSANMHAPKFRYMQDIVAKLDKENNERIILYEKLNVILLDAIKNQKKILTSRGEIKGEKEIVDRIEWLNNEKEYERDNHCRWILEIQYGEEGLKRMANLLNDVNCRFGKSR